MCNYNTIVFPSYCTVPWVPKVARSRRAGAKNYRQQGAGGSLPVFSAPALWEQETSGTQGNCTAAALLFISPLFQRILLKSHNTYLVLENSMCCSVFQAETNSHSELYPDLPALHLLCPYELHQHLTDLQRKKVSSPTIHITTWQPTTNAYSQLSRKWKPLRIEKSAH